MARRQEFDLSPSPPGRRCNPLTSGMMGDVRRTRPGARRAVDHWHEEIEFNLIVRGSASYIVDGEVHVLTPGTLMWLTPRQRHNLTRGPGLEMWVVVFRADLLDAESIQKLQERPSRILEGQEMIGLDRLLSDVAQDSDDRRAYDSGIAYIAKRALRASRDRPSPSPKPMHPAVSRALMLMREPQNTSSLSDLAKAAGVAAPYLSRLLMDHTGRSFVDWRNRIRLDRFLEGYQPGMNLLNGALDAGFGSYARFHHVFAEIVGCPPSEWMIQVQGGKAPSKAFAVATSPERGMPSAAVLSMRQRWTALVPLMSPVILRLLGENFSDRVAGATPRDPSPTAGTLDDLDTSLSRDDLRDLIESFKGADPILTADYAALLDSHDFERLHAGLQETVGLSPSRLVDVVAGLSHAVWGAITREELLVHDSIANKRLTEGVWHAKPLKVSEAVIRRARVALQCHHVVIAKATEAVWASGDPRHFDELCEQARTWSIQAFGRDISAANMSLDGGTPALSFETPVPTAKERARGRN